MPVYAYRALDQSGKTVRGVVDADTPQKARRRLRFDGLHPIELSPASRLLARAEPLARLRKLVPFRPNRLRLLAGTTRQAATLLAAGLPLVTALTTIQEQTEDQEFGHILALVREEVTGGESLANALARRPDVFPMDYIHMIRAGELAGSLDEVLERLAGNLERRQTRRARIGAALTYPALMTLVGAAVLLFLLSFIIPTLTGLFDNLGAALPWPTRLLLAVSETLKQYWWLVVAGLAGVVLAFQRYLKKEANYRRFEGWVFRLPVMGSLFQRLRLAQAIRGLAVMTSGGVTLTRALTATADGMGRSLYAEALRTAAQRVGQGRSLAESLGTGRLFPPLVRRMVAVGEASGTLTDMLSRTAQAYEEETDQALSAMTSLVEPVIIIVMGLLVGFIEMAVLLPIFEISGLVG
ncbi:MAG: type II secretion system F family protein [Proteobacteria bacterium]|nr:type II secretion system F family protein [Pseudomonadota bacterium]